MGVPGPRCEASRACGRSYFRLSTSGVQTKWTDFKTYCWNDTTNPSVALAAGVALAQASINVVGTPSPVAYDVCVENVTVQ